MEQNLRDALDVLAPEVERTTGIDLVVVDHGYVDPLGRDWVMLMNEEGSGLGIWVNEGDSSAQQLAHLADQLQEWVVEGALAPRPASNVAGVSISPELASVGASRR